MNEYFVYILTNRYHSVLYTGITNNLNRRLAEHRLSRGLHHFTSRYNVTQLVYFESTTDVLSAIRRERQIKSGSRQTKIALIESINPRWDDLSKTASGP